MNKVYNSINFKVKKLREKTSSINQNSTANVKDFITKEEEEINKSL